VNPVLGGDLGRVGLGKGPTKGRPQAFFQNSHTGGGTAGRGRVCGGGDSGQGQGGNPGARRGEPGAAPRLVAVRATKLGGASHHPREKPTNQRAKGGSARGRGHARAGGEKWRPLRWGGQPGVVGVTSLALGVTRKLVGIFGRNKTNGRKKRWDPRMLVALGLDVAPAGTIIVPDQPSGPAVG